MWPQGNINLRYEAPQTLEKKTGLRDHTDKMSSGSNWIIVILQVWTNGRLHNAEHRVMMSGKEQDTRMHCLPLQRKANKSSKRACT
ncbi:hypothetical protein M5689_020642 [Euphorbia peplus]|nr:hypothetical protein M5689_020642 [Euphorbia peplus]